MSQYDYIRSTQDTEKSLRPLPIVSIVVPFFGLTNSLFRILKGNPKKELQWGL